jgi:sigma-B regulation protein RsbU (phosphoserine phosphatase)
MRALIADDDYLTTTILAKTLERWGLDSVVAPDGTQAWEILQRDADIGMAILDWVMPGMEGPELCRRIRQHPDRGHLHVLLLTARDSRADLIAGLDAGADDYLVKPFDQEELRARIHVGLRMLGLQARLTDRVTELQVALSKVKQLQGLLPICSYCKKVRPDRDYWEQVEDYVSHHTGVQFSHGICPTCYAAVMESLDKCAQPSGTGSTGRHVQD